MKTIGPPRSAFPSLALALGVNLVFCVGSLPAVPLERFDRITEPRPEDNRHNLEYAAQQADKATTLKGQHNRWYATHNRPMGLEPYSYAGHHYYRSGQSVYAPYFYQGRTIYIYIPQKDGRPVPPPLAENLDFIFIQ